MAQKSGQPPRATGSKRRTIPINDLVRHTAAIRPVIDGAIAEVLDSGWYVLGPKVEEFEVAFAEMCRAGEAVGVANGTDALEIALRALGVGRGDEVITVANAGGYSTTAIVAVGAKAVYSEIDPVTLLADESQVKDRIGPRTAAIIVTHLYGRAAPVDRIVALAGPKGIPVIEDCAQAHGASVAGRSVGGWGTLGCFSFYPTKNLGALGDAGAITGSDADLIARVRRMRQYGWGDKYRAVDIGGRNSRLDEVQAAVLSAQLPLLTGWNRRRRDIGDAYRKDITHPRIVHIPYGEADILHLAVVWTGERASLRAHLADLAVGTDVHYPHPDYAALADNTIRLEHTEAACTSVLTLPCFPEMTDVEVTTVIEAVNSWPA